MRPHFPSAEPQTASETRRWFLCCPPWWQWGVSRSPVPVLWPADSMNLLLRWQLERRCRDGNGSSYVTRDPWPLHYFILLMGLGGGVAWWYWTTLRSWKQTKLWITIKPPTMIKGVIEWVSSFLTSTKLELRTKNCTGHVTHPKMVTHLTHDQWPTDQFPSLRRCVCC